MPSTKTKEARQTKGGVLQIAAWEVRNITDTDIVIINAYTNEDLPIEQLYQQSLKTLPTTEGQSFIAAGATAIIKMDAAIKSKASDTLNLIVAKADTLFPIKVIDLEPGSYPPFTITGEEIANMKLAESFMHVIKAFPSSRLAQDFTSALADTGVTEVEAFFKRTEDYQPLTLDMIVAVETYYLVFPFAWADYAKSKTYSLYTSDGQQNHFAGYFALENHCTLPLSVDQSVPGFTMAYQKDDFTEPQTLYYSNGQFTDDPTSESPGICLRGLFRLKSDLTGVETDKSIAKIVTGTVAGNQVLGYDGTWEKKDENGDRTILDSLSDPKTFTDWLYVCGAIIGIMLFVGLSCFGAKMLRTAFKKWKDSRMDPEIKGRLNEFTQRNLDELQRLGLNADEYPTEVTKYWEKAKKYEIDRIWDNNRARVFETWREQEAYLDMITKYGRNDNTEMVKDSLGSISGWMVDNQGAQHLPEVLPDFVIKFDTNLKVMNNEVARIRDRTSAAERGMLDKSRRAIEESTGIIKQNEEAREYLEENEIPDIIE